MIVFEELVVSLSKDPLARLHDAAAKAASDPKRGVDIKNKAAFFVIRDCAAVTRRWLPCELLLGLDKSVLSGKVGRQTLEDFVTRGLGSSDIVAGVMLRHLLSYFGFAATATSTRDEGYDRPEDRLGDIYGEYSTMSDEDDVLEVVDVGGQDQKVVLDFLCSKLCV